MTMITTGCVQTQPTAATALQGWIADKGPVLQLGARRLTVEGISVDGDIAVGTFSCVRTSYLGVMCDKVTVPGRPDAEVWSLIAGRRSIGQFAVDGGQLLALKAGRS